MRAGLFLGGVIALAALVLAAAGCGGDDESSRAAVGEGANLLLIVVDTLRPDHTGCYGYERPTTPHIDELASESILFENAIAQAAFTLPSMATLFTSLNPIGHGVRRHPDAQGRVDPLPAGLTTLSEMLKTRGYATAAVISNSLFQKRFQAGFDAGIDFYDVGHIRRDAGPTTDVAIKYLEANAGSKKPFFLWVHYIDPHWPYDAPPGFERPFRHDDGGQYEWVLDRFYAENLPREVLNFHPPLDADGVAAGICEYDNEVAYADAEIGRLLAYFEDKGLADNTIVALVSDHGEALGEHGLTFGHSMTLYDEIQKVVFILRPPGGLEPVRVGSQVRLLDFVPTVLAMMGIETPAGCEGRDLAPLWTRGPDAMPDAPAYAESDEWVSRTPGVQLPGDRGARHAGNAGKWKMVRYGDFKLIWIPGVGFELYDLEADPRELVNLHDRPPEAARPLARILKRFLTEPEETVRSSLGPDLNEETRRDLERVLRSLGY